MAVNKLTIGQMRQNVYFLSNAATVSATTTRNATSSGGKNDNYSILLITRGMLRKSHGNRELSFGLVEEAESYTLICRFQTTLESNLRSDTKIIIDSKTYTIKSREKVEEINHLYKFTLATSSEQIDPADYPGLGIGRFVVS